MNREALLALGFTPHRYPQRDGEFFHIRAPIEHFPYAREHLIDSSLIWEGMAAVLEVLPDGQIQFSVPDADYIEGPHPLNSESGEGLLNEARAVKSSLACAQPFRTRLPSCP